MITKIRLWQWPNILAIDAGVIAALWLWVFAEAQSAAPGIQVYAALAMSVWLTYTADRLFDVNSREEKDLLSARHQFAKRNSKALWPTWWIVLFVNMTTAFISLDSFQLQKGFALLFFCLAYTGLNQILSKRFFPKELLVAIIFASGPQVFLPSFIDWKCLAGFTLLCLANCLAIGWKEQSVDATLKIRSISSIIDQYWIYPLLTACTALSVFSTCAAALAPAALILLILKISSKHLDRELYRVLCDGSLLLGPVVYIFW